MIAVGKKVRQMLCANAYAYAFVKLNDNWANKIRPKCVPSHDRPNRKISLKDIILELDPNMTSILDYDESANKSMRRMKKTKIETGGISGLNFGRESCRKNIKVYSKTNRSQIEKPAADATLSSEDNDDKNSIRGISVSGEQKPSIDVVIDETDGTAEFCYGESTEPTNYINKGTRINNSISVKNIKSNDKLENCENPFDGNYPKSKLTSYKEALEYLKPLEDSALRKEKYRAIGLVGNLDDYFRQHQED